MGGEGKEFYFFYIKVIFALEDANTNLIGQLLKYQESFENRNNNVILWEIKEIKTVKFHHQLSILLFSFLKRAS